MITVIVPAYNEESQIGATVASLHSQTRPPDRIVVVANNCTDDTAGAARAAGAEVIDLPDNPHKKAGALNFALERVLPWSGDDDLILLVDADSVLCPTWLTDGMAHLQGDPAYGAVSGAYVARRGRGLVTLLQRAEYAQERRRVSRRGGRVDVLSGTAMLTSTRVIRELYRSRGFVYDPASLTEDFEVTLAIQALGYDPRCFKELRVVTDVMETWGDLTRQRIRWQRGTIETLFAYGWTPLTRRLWRSQALAYGATAVTIAVVSAWVTVAASGSEVDLRWLALLPLFSLEQVVSSRKAGWVPALVAASLAPMWIYDGYRTAIYWVALTRSLLRADSAWA